MIYVKFGDFKDPLKQNLTLEFRRNQNKSFSILIKSHINHDQIHHIRNNWPGPTIFSPGDCHTKRLLALIHPCLEEVTEIESDPKRRFVSFKVTPSNDRVVCVYAPSGHNTREQLARGHFFEGK